MLLTKPRPAPRNERGCRPTQVIWRRSYAGDSATVRGWVGRDAEKLLKIVAGYQEAEDKLAGYSEEVTVVMIRRVDSG